MLWVPVLDLFHIQGKEKHRLHGFFQEILHPMPSRGSGIAHNLPGSGAWRIGCFTRAKSKGHLCAEQIHHGDGVALEMGVGNGSSGLMAFAFPAPAHSLV